MEGERILVVEDEEDILELIRFNLKKEGFEVVGVETGEDAIKLANKEPYKLILLDLMLPGIGGLDICRNVREGRTNRATPIIMVTARGEESDIISGLEKGADDYITKPFSPKVLVARVKAVLRRGSTAVPGEEDVIRIDGFLIHPGRHEVTVDGNKIDLTHTEFMILHLLARRAGWVFTRYQIVDGIRGEDYVVTDRAVDVSIVGLRKKLGDKAEFIETVRGVGYRFRDS